MSSSSANLHSKRLPSKEKRALNLLHKYEEKLCGFSKNNWERPECLSGKGSRSIRCGLGPTTVTVPPSFKPAIKAETERGQRLPDVDVAQQLKLRERQRFFEEVFQHDVDVYLSSAHLCIRDYKRPPIGSISSMEVNVDLLDQMELIDVSDQDALDVFFSSGEEGVLTSPLPGKGNNNNNEEVISNGLFRHVLEDLEAKSRTSSTSSHSSFDSQTASANGGDTPVVGSDDDETPSSAVRRRTAPPEREKQTSQASPHQQHNSRT